MIISVQYLRALAAFFVLLSHIAEKNIDMSSGEIFYFWQHAGEFGVDIFFVVSGYIMSYTTKNMHQKHGAYFTFIKKRIVRIIPLYWFLTLVALVIYFLVPEQVNSAGNRITVIFQSFFLLPVLDNEAYLLDVAWTLRDEFIFYLIFSIGLIFNRSIGNTLVILILSIILFIPIIFDISSLHGYYQNFLHNMFIEFALGIILFNITESVKNISKEFSIFFIILGFILFYILYSNHEFTHIRGIDSGIVAFIICFGFISLEPTISKRPISLFVELGNASYSIYLLHPFILAAFRMAYNKLPQLHLLGEVEITFFLLYASLFFGYLCYLIIEKNLIKQSTILFIPKPYIPIKE